MPTDTSEFKLKPFNFDEWVENNKLQVVDSLGNPIEILKTDANNNEYPIIGTITNQYGEYPCQFSKEGRMNTGSPKGLVYFLVPKESEEMTEFQQHVLALMKECNCDRHAESYLRKRTSALLNVATKEIKSNLKKKGYIFIKKALFEAMTGVSPRIRAEVEAKLDRPIWHRWNGKEKPVNVLALLDDGKYVVIKNKLGWVGKSVNLYVALDDLLYKLPKEE